MSGHVELWGWNGTAPWTPVLVDAAGHLQVDTLSSALPTGAATAANQATIIGHIDGIEGALGQCYGWDGGEWLPLLFEADDVQNLRVKLYDGANGIDSDLLDSNIFVSGDRGILTRSQICGWQLEPLFSRRTDADAIAAVSREMCLMTVSALYGYNGATFDRLRTESNTAFNLRTKLYDGANGVNASLLSTSTTIAGKYGLFVNATVGGTDGVNWSPIDARHPGDADANARLRLSVVSHLKGYNGATWDRLRTYGTGILKVGRAEIDSTSVRVVGLGAVVAGAHELYWIGCSPNAPNALWSLTDGIAAGGTVKYNHFDTDREAEHLNFDPPIKFTTGIWVETWANMESLFMCYI